MTYIPIRVIEYKYDCVILRSRLDATLKPMTSSDYTG